MPQLQELQLLAKHADGAQHLIAGLPTGSGVVGEILSLLFCIVVGPNIPGILKLLLWAQDDPVQLALLHRNSFGVLSSLQDAAAPNHRQVGKTPGMKRLSRDSVIVLIQADHQHIGALEMGCAHLHLSDNVVGRGPEAVRHHFRQHLPRIRAQNAKPAQRAVHVVTFS